jgi:HTH-type transcriptional regulator/antitoxin HigA
MNIRPVRTEADYRAAQEIITQLLDAPEGSAEAERLEVISALVEIYERDHHAPIGKPDPINAILFMMNEKGLRPKDLEPAIGARGRVSEILHRKRPLTLPMIRALSRLLSIPGDVLLQEYPIVEKRQLKAA